MELNLKNHKISKKQYKVIQYIEQYLVSDHPFRKGNVCPFVAASLKKSCLRYFTCKENEIEKTTLFIKNLLIDYLNFRVTNDIGLSAFVVMLHENYKIENLLIVHHLCKPDFIGKHVMIGATYKTNNAPSLHSDTYYPLRTEIPCLIFRELTVHDLIFLDPNQYSESQKIKFLTSYIEKFSTKHSNHNQVEIAIELLNKYRNKNQL